MTERSLHRELMTLQNGRCGICGDDDRPFVQDHDHHSGMIRGLLCVTCNNLEGKHRCDNVWSNCPVCTWRLRPAVAWLGWTERYVGIGLDTEFHLDDPWQPAAVATEATRQRGAGIIARLYTEAVAS